MSHLLDFMIALLLAAVIFLICAAIVAGLNGCTPLF